MSELWYYVDLKGETAGPVDFSGLTEALRTNGTGLNTLVWIDGMAGWTKAVDMPAIVDRLRLRRSAAPPPARGSQATPAARIVPPHAEASSELTTNTHPWRRFFARHLDAMFMTYLAVTVGGLVFFGVWVLFPAIASPFVLILAPFPLLLLFVLLFLLAEAACLSRFGATPGKALYGIAARTRDGKRLPFKLAFWRAFAVFVRGVGLSLPPVNLITMIVGYVTLKREGETTWDRDGDIIVHHSPFSLLRIILLIVIWSFTLVVAVAGYRG